MHYHEEIIELESVPGVKFKIKKLNPNLHLTFAMTASDMFQKKDFDDTAVLHQKILEQFIWSKSEGIYSPLLDGGGACRLDELDGNLMAIMGLVGKFHELVVRPAFLE